MTTDKEQRPPRKALIKEQLSRSLGERASEGMQWQLISLIDRVKEQDDKDGK